MGRIYLGVQENCVEGTRQISSVTSGEGVAFKAVTKEGEATV